MKSKSYEDLLIWQKGIDIVELIYSITKSFPKEERYGLVDQIRRAAVSVPSNIAEGSERESTKEFIRFLNVSKGSLGELHTQLVIAKRLKILEEDAFSNTYNAIKELGRMINGLKKSLNSKMIAEANTGNRQLATGN